MKQLSNEHSPNELVGRVTRLLRRLRAAVEGAAGRSLTYEELAEITGTPKSTLGNWFIGDGNPDVEILLRLLELVPPGQRHQILDELPICRVYPTLNHPFLTHDLAAVSHCKKILLKDRGVTLVEGNKESLVSFVATALGHSFGLIAGARSRLAGIDVHTPDWFVPVRGITYLNDPLRTSDLSAEVERLWPTLLQKGIRFIVISGLYPRLPGYYQRALSLARECHVLIANKRARSEILPSSKAFGPVHLLTLGQERLLPERIVVEVSTLD
jgi:hypothetical protein